MVQFKQKVIMEPTEIRQEPLILREYDKQTEIKTGREERRERRKKQRRNRKK